VSRPGPSIGPLQLDGLDLVVFDKDGTLIDFDAMWGVWAEDLADRLEAALGSPITTDLHREIGYDNLTRRTIAGSPLAATPMAHLRTMTTELVVRSTGRSFAAAGAAVDAAWLAPDPVALARPLADLGSLFRALRTAGRRVAIVTSDDRAPTEATVASLGLAELVDVLVCSDDGLPSKPAPDTLLHACRLLGVDPIRTAMIGDSIADMRMATAAGVGRRIAVLSGIGLQAELRPLSDVVIDSIAELLPNWFSGSR
jgi:phosphoglycolate phosphatase-like HAD superfamily hydrolase